MFAEYTADQQYRHDTWTRDRDHAILASIRERTAVVTRPVIEARVAARPQRVTWARPIGLRAPDDCSAVCAVG